MSQRVERSGVAVSEELGENDGSIATKQCTADFPFAATQGSGAHRLGYEEMGLLHSLLYFPLLCNAIHPISDQGPRLWQFQKLSQLRVRMTTTHTPLLALVYPCRVHNPSAEMI